MGDGLKTRWRLLCYFNIKWDFSNQTDFFFSWLQHTAKYICGVMIHEGSHEARKAAPHGVLQPTPSACSYGGPGCKKTELDDFLERVAFLHSYISYYDYDLSFT